MKKSRFFICVLAIVLTLTSLLGTTAYAADVHIVADTATIYVDDVEVRNINAYTDGFGEIRVETMNDMARIFPDEFEDLYGSNLPDTTGIIVTDWVENFGYGWSQNGTELYIYRTTVGTGTPTIPATPDSSSTTAEVYVNGMKVKNHGVYMYGGEFFIRTQSALTKIFPNETKGMTFPAVMQVSSLRSWAEKFKYSVAISGNSIYLNNDKKRPMEVTLDGVKVDFPDQQPVVVDPGRTMVPVRAVAELFKCEVEWDGEHSRVIITKDRTKIILWLGYTSYWQNGYYYQMDVAPFSLNGRTMVPLRFIGEAFNFDVEFDGDNPVGLVKLTTN